MEGESRRGSGRPMLGERDVLAMAPRSRQPEEEEREVENSGWWKITVDSKAGSVCAKADFHRIEQPWAGCRAFCSFHVAVLTDHHRAFVKNAWALSALAVEL